MPKPARAGFERKIAMLEQIKTMSLKQKIEYFMDYYFWRTVGVVSIFAVVIFLMVHFATYKQIVTGVLAVNAYGEDKKMVQASDFSGFLAENGRDPDKEQVLVNCNTHVSADMNDSVNRANIESVYTLFMTNAVDIFFADEEFFTAVAQADYLADLRECLTDDILKQHEEDLVYALNSATNKEMVAGIRVSPDSPWMRQTGWYDSTAVVGLTVLRKDEDLAKQMLLDAIMED